MEMCGVCKIEYPEEILSPMILNGGATKSVCGICALELSNRALGVNRVKFQGVMAEDFRQQAIAWRKKNV